MPELKALLFRLKALKCTKLTYANLESSKIAKNVPLSQRDGKRRDGMERKEGRTDELEGHRETEEYGRGPKPKLSKGRQVPCDANEWRTNRRRRRRSNGDGTERTTVMAINRKDGISSRMTRLLITLRCSLAGTGSANSLLLPRPAAQLQDRDPQGRQPDAITWA